MHVIFSLGSFSKYRQFHCHYGTGVMRNHKQQKSLLLASLVFLSFSSSDVDDPHNYIMCGCLQVDVSGWSYI